MATRSSRTRRTRHLPDFEYEEEPKRSLSKRSAGGESHIEKHKKTKVEPTIPEIKLEPDDSCVLPTDNVVTPAPFSTISFKQKKKSVSKPALRTLIGMDLLPLHMLERASPSMLRILFGFLHADELSRQFIYQCRLMPKRCEFSYKSFGNEAKAKANIETHLKNHIVELIEEAAEDGDAAKTKFLAESLPARERREEKERVRAKKSVELPCVVLEKLSSPAKASKNRGTRSRPPAEEGKFTVIKPRMRRFGGQRTNNSQSVSAIAGSAMEVDVEKVNNESNSEVEVEKVDESDLLSRSIARSNMLLETESLISKNSEMIEKLQNKLRLEKQPYKDHPYPILVKGHVRSDSRLPVEQEEVDVRFIRKPYSLFNKSEWDLGDSESEDDGVIHHDLACYHGIMGARMKTGYMIANQVPIMKMLQLPKSLGTAPAVGEEVVIIKSRPKALNQPSSRSGCIVESESDDDGPVTTTLSRPYPPMPKYQPELGTKLIIPEEEIMFPENDEDVPDSWNFDDPEHVKKYAVRCMRDLRLNRGLGARNCNVSCKICDKSFTATATLMYHYRSHANIKPFICLLCNATFTRQHSLNYHMLIHNDATRFKCPDCGRAFRHPSHYKEHRRKHTGEQPYHCPECDMRFKTRNSYKRHITSKHSELDIKIEMRGENKGQLGTRGPVNAPPTIVKPLPVPEETTAQAERDFSVAAETQSLSKNDGEASKAGPEASEPDPTSDCQFKPVLLKMTDMSNGGAKQFTTLKLVSHDNDQGVGGPKSGIILPPGSLTFNSNPSSESPSLVAIPVTFTNTYQHPQVTVSNATQGLKHIQPAIKPGTTKLAAIKPTEPVTIIPQQGMLYEDEGNDAALLCLDGQLPLDEPNSGAML